MTLSAPVADCRELRLHNLNTDAYAHLKLLLYWPVYGFLFLYVERFYKVEQYPAMHCPLDDLIPFCEWFLVLYLFWFVYLVGMHSVLDILAAMPICLLGQLLFFSQNTDK